MNKKELNEINQEWLAIKEYHLTNDSLFESPHGQKDWYLNNDLHVVEYPDGIKNWYFNGDRYRVDNDRVLEKYNDPYKYFMNVLKPTLPVKKTKAPHIPMPSLPKTRNTAILNEQADYGYGIHNVKPSIPHKSKINFLGVGFTALAVFGALKVVNEIHKKNKP